MIQGLKVRLAVLGGLLAIFWGLEVVDHLVLRGSLDQYGIVPWDTHHLWGILFAPFLHVGFGHLIANTVPFLVLGWLVMLRGVRDFFEVSLVAGFIGGLGVWLFGHAGVHLGASGLIYGYLGYLMLRGFFERKFWWVALSLVVAYFYGAALMGVFPGQPGVSWEGHLFGFVGGVVAARLMARTPADSAKP